MVLPFLPPEHSLRYQAGQFPEDLDFRLTGGGKRTAPQEAETLEEPTIFLIFLVRGPRYPVRLPLPFPMEPILCLDQQLITQAHVPEQTLLVGQSQLQDPRYHLLLQALLIRDPDRELWQEILSRCPSRQVVEVEQLQLQEPSTAKALPLFPSVEVFKNQTIPIVMAAEHTACPPKS